MTRGPGTRSGVRFVWAAPTCCAGLGEGGSPRLTRSPARSERSRRPHRIASARPRARPASRARAHRPEAESTAVDAAASDHPRDHRVRVPHLPVPSSSRPHTGVGPARQLEYAPRAIFVVAQSPRAVHRLGDVRDVSAAPQTDLVAEDPKPACPATADRAFGDDAPLLAAQVRGPAPAR